MTDETSDPSADEGAARRRSARRRTTQARRDDRGTRTDRPARPASRPTEAVDEAPTERLKQLENEGDIAADYLEELLDIADLDGDLDMDVEGDRASVSIVGGDLEPLVGRNGEVLDALQELTRLAVLRETGERSRLMLDIGGHRAERRAVLEGVARDAVDAGQGVRRAGLAQADDPVRAQGRPRRGGGRRAGLGLRGCGAAAVRRGAARPDR